MPYDPPVLNRNQVRAVDRRAIEVHGVSSLVLMENAGRGSADVLARLEARGPVVIFCGKGNNGGDGFVLARHLHLREIGVRVVSAVDPGELTGDAAANCAILRQAAVPFAVAEEQSSEWRSWCGAAEWIVDALLGTGTQGAPRPPYDALIRLMNKLPARKLALDLPSGLDCDTGAAADPTFRAQHTCTFAAAKPGLLVEQARPYVGELHVLDIGLPIEWLVG